MPYLATAQSFLEQSRLLISARPTTARITTKYNLPHPSPPPHPQRPSSLKPKDDKKIKKDSKHRDAKARIAILEFKCYDPVSGTCLKYKTDKGAEVGRLMTGLGGCGRAMTGLPPKVEDEPKAEEVDGVEKGASASKDGEKVKDAAPQDTKKDPQKQGGGGGGGGGAGKKKKKGKR